MVKRRKGGAGAEDYLLWGGGHRARLGALMSSCRWAFVCTKAADLSIERHRGSCEQFERKVEGKLIDGRNLQLSPDNVIAVG